jgi:hypothetical protein
VTTYVYGFTRASHRLPVDGLVGVGETAPPLRIVRQHDLAAVVSDAPEGLRAKRRDLEAHERILETLQAAGTVLPTRFGTLAPDDKAVRAELATRATRYAELLSRLEGKVEINVKAVHREDAVLRDLLLGDEGLRRMNQALRAAGGGDRQAKVELGEKIAALLEVRRAGDGERVVAALRPHASAVSIGPPVDGCFVNASFLVAAASEDFQAALSRLREEHAELIDLRVYGPLPPYSFVALDEAAR